MPTDEAKLTELLDRFVTDLDVTGHVTATQTSHPSPVGTWTIDPSNSSISFARRRLRLWTITRRRHCLGVIHLDDLPPVGVIRFQQPSGLPVLTMALDPASVETPTGDLATMLGGPEVVAVGRYRWWTLRSESLELLPSGAWRVMATLTANGTSSLVELRLEVDPQASGPDRLVLNGQGLLDRRAFGIARSASTFRSQIWLELAVRAKRVRTHSRSTSKEKSLCTTSMLG
jgi:polyisoprenoid-binding protein YceI